MATTGSKRTRRAGTKTERFEGRLTPDQKLIIQRAADIAGLSFSDFVAQSAEKQAHETITRNETMVLSVRDSIAFVEALLNPRVDHGGLAEALAEHDRLVDSRP